MTLPTSAVDRMTGKFLATFEEAIRAEWKAFQGQWDEERILWSWRDLATRMSDELQRMFKLDPDGFNRVNDRFAAVIQAVQLELLEGSPRTPQLA